jgi:hypothetical protein
MELLLLMAARQILISSDREGARPDLGSHSGPPDVAAVAAGDGEGI